jgi:5-methylcytosine-specific restriction endonuclease McrA
MTRVCREPGCPNLRPCSTHPEPDNRSPSSRRTSTHAWQKRIRPFILRRDHGICHICKRPGADQVDHLTPVSMGGTDDPSNLAAAHARCNNERGNRV